MKAIDSYIDQAKEAGVLSFWQLWAKFADFANAALLNLMHLVSIAFFCKSISFTNVVSNLSDTCCHTVQP